MPRPGDYTPARRQLMQAAMWVILGATVALAAVVGRVQRRARQVDLSTQVSHSGRVSVRLPAKWRARPVSDVDRRIIAQAAEGEPGREITVMYERLLTPQSPMQYLSQSFDLEVAIGGQEAKRLNLLDQSPTQMIHIAGEPGILFTSIHPMPQRDEAVLKKEVIACCVLPSLDVLVVRLEGYGLPDPSDAEVVKQVASAIGISDEPPLGKPGDVVDLGDGASVVAPAALSPVSATEPDRRDRRLWHAQHKANDPDQFERQWSAVELVACLFASYDPSDLRQRARAEAAVATLLIVRDPRWRQAKISQDGARLWHAEPAQGSNDFFARAYLAAGENGRAILAIVHRGTDAAQEFDSSWAQLLASAKFGNTPDIAAMEQAGADEVNRLKQEGLHHLLEARDEQWSVWTNISDHSHVGWSHLEWEPGSFGGSLDLRLRRLAGQVMALDQNWSVKPDLSSYSAAVTRGEKSDDALRQTTHVRASELSMSVARRNTPLYQWRVTPPPQYVPGAMLPLLMGKLSPRPMLLRTETFLGAEGVGPMDPLTLIVRPDPASKRTAHGETKPLRCKTVLVNGTGQVSRWYVRDSGEVESVEFGGLRRVDGDLQSIRVDFGREGALAP